MFSPFAPTISTHTFARDHTEADAAFCQLAQQLSLPVVSTQIPAVGLAGEALFTRHLWLGAPDAASVLVLISGTHGIEGLAGSAIQQDLLAQVAAGQWRPPADLALLIIHLLNPYGCAWLRRCDQAGIDLNRNFVDFSRPLPDNPGYRELREVLLFGSDSQRQQAQTDYAARHGQVALEVAVSGGQFCDAAGPWFGGHKAAFARQYIESLMAHYRLGERTLGVVDLHTGLGPFGHAEIICDHPARSPGTRVAQSWFGQAVTLPDLGTSFSAPKVGLMDYAWHRIMREGSCFVTLEFGTGSTERLFQVLLDDHALHAAGQIDWASAPCRQVKAALLAHFYPDDEGRREAVLAGARRVIGQAWRGLAASMGGCHHG